LPSWWRVACSWLEHLPFSCWPASRSDRLPPGYRYRRAPF